MRNQDRRRGIMTNQIRRSPRWGRLSEFPDELLLKILSFLPSKDVVATSAISKRWKSLWKEVKKFRYDATPSYPQTFQMFALFIRSRSNVESLQLKLNPNNSRQDFKDLVNYAVARSLRELRIEMLYKSFEFPQSLYLYPQLETLILEKLSLVDIPSNVSLIGVKKLHLLSVRFSSDESVTKLLSRCPLLEDLVVRRSTYTNVMVFTVGGPTLKCLSIDNTSGKSRPEGVHGFVINAPSLRCFSIKDTFSNYVRFGDMPELVKASVNIVCDQPIPTERETVQSTSSKM
uniref:F-box domain-containing protein n=1 Tax=Brassica campestris TaxID=3711 RepID=M4F660_BRACM